MATNQPIWRCIANLGDVHPLEYGGYFVYVDDTGVYAPEAEILLEPVEGDKSYTIHRFTLEPCTYVDGILSDNPYHPGKSAWFAGSEAQRKERPQDTTYLSNVADWCMDGDVDELIRLFCSGDPLERAYAWRAVGEYHGWDNLDSYPLRLTEAEATARYASYLENE